MRVDQLMRTINSLSKELYEALNERQLSDDEDEVNLLDSCNGQENPSLG